MWPVIEDACQAQWRRIKGRKAVTLGDWPVVFQFFIPEKTLEHLARAGAVVTSDPAIQQKFK